MTTKRLFLTLILLANLLANGPGAFADGQALKPIKEASAIAVLQAADRAIREIEGLSYRAEYVGAFTSRGRVASDVLLRREDGADEAMQSIAYTAKIEVSAHDAPYAQEHYPRQYTVVETNAETRLIDPQERTVEIARGLDRMRLNYGALTSGTLPQYLRPEPLQFEIEDSIAAAHLGTTMLDGLEVHMVWLKFADDSGFGEQLLYFGVDDHLLRRATLVAPETELAGGPEDAEASNPTIFIDLTLHDLKTLPRPADDAFTPDLSGFKQVVLGGEAGVGEVIPDWSLPLPGGGSLSSKELRGQAVVLYFWASWCPTCHRHMPAVQAIHDRFSGDIRVLAVNAFDRNDALAHIRERGYTFEVALEGDVLANEVLGFPGQPALVVLDGDGVVRYRALARDPSDEELWALLDDLAASTR